MYEFALEENQRYKEAHVILEKALIREKEGFVEDLLAWIELKIMCSLSQDCCQCIELKIQTGYFRKCLEE